MQPEANKKHSRVNKKCKKKKKITGWRVSTFIPVLSLPGELLFHCWFQEGGREWGGGVKGQPCYSQNGLLLSLLFTPLGSQESTDYNKVWPSIPSY